MRQVLVESSYSVKGSYQNELAFHEASKSSGVSLFRTVSGVSELQYLKSSIDSLFKVTSLSKVCGTISPCYQSAEDQFYHELASFYKSHCLTKVWLDGFTDLTSLKIALSECVSLGLDVYVVLDISREKEIYSFIEAACGICNIDRVKAIGVKYTQGVPFLTESLQINTNKPLILQSIVEPVGLDKSKYVYLSGVSVDNIVEVISNGRRPKNKKIKQFEIGLVNKSLAVQLSACNDFYVNSGFDVFGLNINGVSAKDLKSFLDIYLLSPLKYLPLYLKAADYTPYLDALKRFPNYFIVDEPSTLEEVTAFVNTGCRFMIKTNQGQFKDHLNTLESFGIPRSQIIFRLEGADPSYIVSLKQVNGICICGHSSDKLYDYQLI